MMKDIKLSRIRLKKLFRENGAVAITDGAIDELENLLFDIADQITKDTIKLVGFAKRKKVTGQDVRFSSK